MIGIVLGLGAVTSVLAFGGVEVLAFAPAQIAVVILAMTVFWRHDWPVMPLYTLLVLGILLILPLFQLIPLPHTFVAAAFPARGTLAENVLGSMISGSQSIPLTVNSHETLLSFLRLVCYVLVFLLAFHAYQSRGAPAALVGVLLGLGVAEAIYGIVQYLTAWQFLHTSFQWIRTEEARGTYVNRNNFAGLLEMVLPFALARLLLPHWLQGSNRRSAFVQAIVSPATSRLLRDLLLFCFVCLGLIFSRSRMGIVSGMAGILVVGSVAYLQSRRQLTLLILFLFLAVPVGYSLWIGLNPVVERFELLSQPGAIETDRLPVWRDTLSLIRDYPWLGTGLGTYRWSNQHYQTDKLYGVYEHAHNDYLEFAADIGIPATALLFASLWVLVARVAQHARALERSRDRVAAAGCAGALAAILIHGITDFNLQIPANAFLFSWIAGTAAGLVAKRNV